MDKNKGIWIAIASIVIIGIAITFATNSFIKDKGMPKSVSAAPQAAGIDSEAAVNTEQSQNQASSAPALGRSRMIEPEPVMAETSGSISPLEPESGNMPAGIEKKDAKEYYEKHLAELDNQIQKMREESSDPNTYSMKALAEKELKIWNKELNTIYTNVLDALDSEAKTALKNSQQVWLKSRDIEAEDAAKKYSGGSLEGVEYTASLAESTRQRTYDLVGEYVDVLSSKNE